MRQTVKLSLNDFFENCLKHMQNKPSHPINSTNAIESYWNSLDGEEKNQWRQWFFQSPHSPIFNIELSVKDGDVLLQASNPEQARTQIFYLGDFYKNTQITKKTEISAFTADDYQSAKLTVLGIEKNDKGETILIIEINCQNHRYFLGDDGYLSRELNPLEELGNCFDEFKKTNRLSLKEIIYERGEGGQASAEDNKERHGKIIAIISNNPNQLNDLDSSEKILLFLEITDSKSIELASGLLKSVSIEEFANYINSVSRLIGNKFISQLASNPYDVTGKSQCFQTLIRDSATITSERIRSQILGLITNNALRAHTRSEIDTHTQSIHNSVDISLSRLTGHFVREHCRDTSYQDTVLDQSQTTILINRNGALNFRKFITETNQKLNRQIEEFERNSDQELAILLPDSSESTIQDFRLSVVAP
jgi:hypothetical protein